MGLREYSTFNSANGETKIAAIASEFFRTLLYIQGSCASSALYHRNSVVLSNVAAIPASAASPPPAALTYRPEIHTNIYDNAMRLCGDFRQVHVFSTKMKVMRSRTTCRGDGFEIVSACCLDEWDSGAAPCMPGTTQAFPHSSLRELLVCGGVAFLEACQSSERMSFC
jgi:hypothetical protein